MGLIIMIFEEITGIKLLPKVQEINDVFRELSSNMLGPLGVPGDGRHAKDLFAPQQYLYCLNEYRVFTL